MASSMKWKMGPRCSALLTAGLMIAALCALHGCGSAVEPQPLPGQTTEPDPGLETDAEADQAPADNNRTPLADAGADLQAVGGETVQLDGGASVDEDGDELRFSWTQTDGAPVALTGAATATPTFTAPNEDVELEFELTVTDGRGGEDFASVRVLISARLARLFIVNRGGTSILSYEDPGSVNGNVAPDTNLQGDQTQLLRANDVVVASDGAMIVSDLFASLAIFDDAADTNGNIEPDGLVQGAATRLRLPFSLALNGPEDLVLVANARGRRITVYDRGPGASLNGNLAPVRTIATTTTGDMRRPIALDFGANDELYVVDGLNDNVLVFANASALNGDVAPSRIIQSSSFLGIVDVFVDGDDTMYVVDSADGEVLIFENASTLNGEQTPDAVLTVEGAGQITAVAVDATGTGYITDRFNKAIVVYDDIATANGSFLPDRTITGLQTQIEQPGQLFLQE